MRLRVLLSAYACQPGLGSEPGVGWNWACALAKAGADVWVLTAPDGKAAIERDLTEELRANLKFVYVEHSKLWRLLRRLPWGEYWIALAWQERAYKVANALELQVGFDVIHHVSWGSLHVGSRLWRLKCPLIFGPVGGGQTAPAGFRRHFRGAWVTEVVRTIVVRYFSACILNARSTVRRATVVLVANRDTEVAARYLGARDVRVMVDVGLRADKISSHSPVAKPREQPIQILWVAMLRPRKGLLLALEALSLIDIHTSWRLTIIGDGPQGSMVPTWVNALGLDGKVEWRGALPWAEVHASYDHADLFLSTSLRDTTGVQLLEAMGRGLPILTLDHHGAASLVPDSAGIKVPVSTPKETTKRIARAIEMLAADRDLMREMGEAAIAVARCYTFDVKAMNALAIYKEVMERNKSGGKGCGLPREDSLSKNPQRAQL